MLKISIKIYIRIFLLIALGATLSYLAFQGTAEYARKNFFIPANSFLYVDQRYEGQKENGSFFYPFKTINAAVNFAKENPEFKTIMVSDGNYSEKVELVGDINLIGTGEFVNIVSPEEKQGSVLKMAGKGHIISKLNVIGGRYGIYLDKDSTADIINISAKEANWYGIYNEKKDEAGENFDIRIISSTVSNNKLQGLYLQKAKILLSNSVASENGEEGVDLHVGMNSIIRNNDIRNNGEGGIETEIGENSCEIYGNEINGNSKSGINVQSYGENSHIVIKNNVVKENVNFGLRCALHQGAYKGYFRKHVDFKEGNDFSENGMKDIDPNCDSSRI